MKKDNHINQIPDPEKFWPDAEKLLDQHFIQKRRKKYFAFALIASLVLVGSAYFIISNKAEVRGSKTYVVLNSENSVSTQTEVAPSIQSTEINKNEATDFTKQNLNSTNDNFTGNKPAQINNSSEKKISRSNQLSTIKPVDNNKSNSPAEYLTTINKETIHSSKADDESFDKLSITESDKEIHSDPIPVSTYKDFDKKDSKRSVQYIAGIHKVELNQLENRLHAEEPFVLNNNLKKHSTKGLSIGVYALIQNISKDLKSEGKDEYVDRRNHEEKNMVAPGIGINATINRNNFSYAIGIEYSYFGEKTSYEAYSKQTQYIQSGNWQTYTHTVTDVDTAYISGLQWFLETQVSQLDSTYETRTDTNFINLYDPSISNRNSVSKIKYLEIPIMFSYRIPVNKFDFGISVGVSAAWIFAQSGHYLKQDLSGVESINESKPFNSFVLNGRVGLDIAYHVSPRIRIFGSPAWKTNLSPITKSNQGYSQKYSALGLQLGAAYNIY